MAANYFENLGEMSFDNIANGAGVPVVTGLRTILTGQGVLKRGTALGVNADGKMVILGTASATANCILAEDVDTAAGDANALVYLSGHFNRNMLTVKDSYTITADDVEKFRAAGIFLGNSVD